jgi:hypothetical protein
MAILVVEFSREGYKISSSSQMKLPLEKWSSGKLSKSAKI